MSNSTSHKAAWAIVAVVAVAATAVALFALLSPSKGPSSAGKTSGTSSSHDVLPSAPRTLTIGAWNIEWLGQPASRSGPARNVAQKSQDLIKYIAESHVDVLALEEICDDDLSAAATTNTTLTTTFSLLSREPGQSWNYLLFPKKDVTELTQLTGVAWNQERVRLVGDPYRIPVGDDLTNSFDEWDRHPHAVKFTVGDGLTDFVLVPIHMKSNRGGATTTSQQRALEASVLVAALDGVRRHFEDDDVLLLGDFNVLGAQEPAVSIYTAAGLRDLNSADLPTTHSGPAPFDRIFVTQGEREFEQSRLTVRSATDSVLHKTTLSDHYMVTTVIDVIADEDVLTDRPTPSELLAQHNSAAGAAPVPTAPVSVAPNSTVIAAVPAATGDAPPLQPDPVPPTNSPFPEQRVRIAKTTPDPVGDDSQNETITLKNTTPEAVSLVGWTVRDLAKKTWSLDPLGALAPGEEKTVQRSGQEMALNNDGDEVELVNAQGQIVDRLRYDAAERGVEIIASP